MAKESGSAALWPMGGPDEKAFVCLLNELRPNLLRFVAQRGLAQAAEDIVQETLLAAITAFRARKFEGRSSPTTWVFGILRNKISDHRRHGGRDDLHLVPLDHDSSPPDQGTALAHPASQECSVLVHEVLESLPLRHWMVLMLNQRENLTTDEISRIIRLSAGRTGAILAEAKQMFRDGVKGKRR